MSAYEWRYLPGGGVKHLLSDTWNAAAVCGVSTLPAAAWYGTGSQAEYETAEALRKCKRCVARTGGRF